MTKIRSSRVLVGLIQFMRLPPKGSYGFRVFLGMGVMIRAS